MSTRYLSFDIQGKVNDDLLAFIRKNKGEAITRSLYRFETDVSLEDFRSALGEAANGDESVLLIIRTKGGLAHGRVVTRSRSRVAGHGSGRAKPGASSGHSR